MTTLSLMITILFIIKQNLCSDHNKTNNICSKWYFPNLIKKKLKSSC